MDRASLTAHTRAELLVLARQHGLVLPDRRRKADIIAALLAATAEPPDAPEATPDATIPVRGTATDRRVAFWEKHPAHPGGEVYLVGTETGRVGETPAVRRALAIGRIVREETP